MCLFLYLLPSFNDSRLDTCFVAKGGWIFFGLIVFLAIVNVTFVLSMSLFKFSRQNKVKINIVSEPGTKEIKIRGLK